jgi:hypothetical protein
MSEILDLLHLARQEMVSGRARRTSTSHHAGAPYPHTDQLSSLLPWPGKFYFPLDFSPPTSILRSHKLKFSPAGHLSFSLSPSPRVHSPRSQLKPGLAAFLSLSLSLSSAGRKSFLSVISGCRPPSLRN